MKNSSAVFIKILLSLAMLLQFSCSWIGVRDPAAKKEVQTISVDEVFSIKSGAQAGATDVQQQFFQSLPYKGNKVSYVAELSKDLPDGVAFRVELDVVEDKYVFKILHAKNAFKDNDATFELGHFLSKLGAGGGLQDPVSLFEMYYNAREGDAIALDNFLKIKRNPSAYYSNFAKQPADYQQRLVVNDDLRSELAADIKEIKRQRKILAEKRKDLMDKLDKAPDAKQFKTLVAKGDRKGVADLLQKYLPFEEMAPFETRFWETYLDVIRNPVPLDQRILIYRGLGDDFIHIAYDGAKEADKAEALKEGKTFVMSTVLVKNQGSWNRRLRSLESMNDKFIATINNSNEFSQSARISTMYLQHSANPQGSPFLSFTPRFHTAQSFGSGKMMLGLIDPRLLQFNYVSKFPNEIEFLLPLVTFPDEMAGFWHMDYHNGIDRNTHLEERLKILIENEYGKGKADSIIKRIKKNTHDFFAPVFKEGGAPVEGVKGGTMAAFYKKFAKANEFKPAFTPDGNITCKDLLKLFWAVP